MMKIFESIYLFDKKVEMAGIPAMFIGTVIAFAFNFSNIAWTMLVMVIVGFTAFVMIFNLLSKIEKKIHQYQTKLHEDD